MACRKGLVPLWQVHVADITMHHHTGHLQSVESQPAQTVLSAEWSFPTKEALRHGLCQQSQELDKLLTDTVPYDTK